MGNEETLKLGLWRLKGTTLALMKEDVDMNSGETKLVIAEKWDIKGAAIEFEHGANVSSSSAAKVLMWGVFALASTFNKNKVYIIVELADGTNTLIEENARLEREARQFALAMQKAAGKAKTTKTEGDAPDPIEQLKRLGELRDAGVVTAEEFETKKAELLSRI